MTVTAKWYSAAIINAFGSASGGGAPNIDYLSDTIKVALCSSSYTPDQDAHDFFDDITNELSTALGYTQHGATLTTKSIAYDSGANVIGFKADPVSWAGASFTFRYAIIYDSTPGSDATRPLLGYVDMGANVTALGGVFTLVWDTSGLLIVTIS